MALRRPAAADEGLASAEPAPKRSVPTAKRAAPPAPKVASKKADTGGAKPNWRRTAFFGAAPVLEQKTPVTQTTFFFFFKAESKGKTPASNPKRALPAPKNPGSARALPAPGSGRSLPSPKTGSCFFSTNRKEPKVRPPLGPKRLFPLKPLRKLVRRKAVVLLYSPQ